VPISDNVVGLVITGVFGVVIAVVGGLMARRGARLGQREGRAPDVEQMWEQQEADRLARQRAEDLWWAVRRAFQSYFRRVTALADALALPPEKRRRFELLPAEKRAIDAEMPSDDEWLPKRRRGERYTTDPDN
jgi:thioesterase domain-containing protein